MEPKSFPETKELSEKAINLLKQLIKTPSFSGQEAETAKIIGDFFSNEMIPFQQEKNNIIVKNRYYDPQKPILILNSHHDTVKPNPAYSRDPFAPDIMDGKLYGLGSNDAGASLVALAITFLHFYNKNNLNYNLIFVASAEEENSGKNGIECVLPLIQPPQLAIVGEPTKMDVAIAEKGLMVIDCISRGKAGHAARDEGENAIYNAIKDIEWFSTYKFPKISETLGEIRMTATIIHAGSQHNVIPAECSFTVDVRCTDAYTMEETLEIIKSNVSCEVTPRSMRMKPTGINQEHPIVKAAKNMGRKTYGSPTTSDKALIPCESIKMGPGDSARSHTADEFIYLNEIKEGISIYIHLLNSILL